MQNLAIRGSTKYTMDIKGAWRRPEGKSMPLKPKDVDRVIELMRQIVDALRQSKLSPDEQEKYSASSIPPLRKELRLFLVPRWDEIWPYTTQAAEHPGFKINHRAYGNVKYNLERDIEASFLMETSNWYDYAKAVGRAYKKLKIIDELECVKARLEHAQTKSELSDKTPVGTGQNAAPAKYWSRLLTFVKRIPRWIYVLIIFLAALLTVFHLLEWLEPIKVFIYKILLPK